MKYVVVIGDGMADLPLKELDGETPFKGTYS
jgi:2,3-bisphosphoglycerate-independent phosphoglycerate mutase